MEQDTIREVWAIHQYQATEHIKPLTAYVHYALYSGLYAYYHDVGVKPSYSSRERTQDKGS